MNYQFNCGVVEIKLSSMTRGPLWAHLKCVSFSPVTSQSLLPLIKLDLASLEFFIFPQTEVWSLGRSCWPKLHVHSKNANACVPLEEKHEPQMMMMTIKRCKWLWIFTKVIACKYYMHITAQLVVVHNRNNLETFDRTSLTVSARQVHIISEEPEKLCGVVFIQPWRIKVFSLLDSCGIKYWPYMFLIITRMKK